MTVPTGLFLPSYGPQTYIYAGAASPTETITRWGDGSGWQYNFLGNSSRTSNVLTLVDNGNVGFGCNSPQTPLDVRGSGRFYNTSATLLVGTPGNDYFYVNAGGGGYASLDMNGYFRVIQNNQSSESNTLFLVPSDTNQPAWYSNGTGGFGVGTKTPATALDVNGGVTIRNGYRPITQIYTTAGPISLVASSYGTHFYITNSSVTSITFATTFPNAQIDSNGYWVFRNATGSYLSTTITWPSTISNSSGSSISLSGSSTTLIPIAPSNSITLMFTNGLGNYGLYNNGGTSSNYFAIF